jgi:hypothetical protein
MRRRAQILVKPSHVGKPRLYHFDASLRIAGIGEHHEAISKRTGIAPAHAHRKGEPKFAQKRWQEDIWILESPLGATASLDQHIEWLWNAVASHRDYFQQLISQSSSADVVLGCFSESPYPYLTVQPDSLRLLRELDLGISFNFTCV